MAANATNPSRGAMRYAVNIDLPTSNAGVRNTECGYYISRTPKKPEHGGWRSSIGVDDNALPKRVFDELSAERASIEAEFAALPAAWWNWHRHDAYTFSSINVVRHGAIHHPPDRLSETRA